MNQAGQPSAVWRDLNEPGWREREAAHIKQFTDKIPILGDEQKLLRSEVERLRKELLNIADAKRFDRSMFPCDEDWANWAQSRARNAANGGA